MTNWMRDDQREPERCARDLPGMESAADALLDAVTRGKSHLVKFLLDACEKEVEVATNYRDFKGKTPLIRAVYITEEKCRQRIMELLLAHGAEPNSQDDAGRTALSYACELRRNDVVRMLVKHNVDPELPDVDGNTPLMHCARVGNDTGIAVLIKCFKRLGLDIDRCNREGNTALLIAARRGYVECASMLAVSGRASVTKTDPEFGRNAEQWARAQGCTTPEVVAFSQQMTAGGLQQRRRRPQQQARREKQEMQVSQQQQQQRDHHQQQQLAGAGACRTRVRTRPSRSSTLTTRVSCDDTDDENKNNNDGSDLSDVDDAMDDGDDDEEEENEEAELYGGSSRSSESDSCSESAAKRISNK